MDYPTQAALRQQLRSSRAAVRQTLDEVLRIMRGFYRMDLVSKTEVLDCLNMHRTYMAQLSMIESCYLGGMALTADWAIDRLKEFSITVEKYIVELEEFNNVEIRQRWHRKYPDQAFRSPQHSGS